MSTKFSFPKNKMKIALLENVHKDAVNLLVEEGYDVQEIPKSLSSEDLLGVISDAHILGIRSKTQVKAEHFKNASRLLAVGCFGVGTNQVDLDAARASGVPVFNAPYGNTRSVAELTIGNIIMLARRAAECCIKMHAGRWQKSAKGSYEVRGKTLGLVGYGHIGQQVGILAEALGMHVIFFDMLKRLPLGTSKQVATFQELLQNSNFISLHVPAKANGSALIGKDEIAQMKKGSYLLNLSRGTLIDFAALKEAVLAGDLGGAAVDVYPKEPKTNDEPFETELCGVPNIILTPHIGGSTEEAQANIGIEVASTFISYINEGSSAGAVNFPQVALTTFPDSHRILHIHKNEPGVVTEVNKIISSIGANINAQTLSTFKDVGYLIVDVDCAMSDQVKHEIGALPSTIKTRILY